MHDLSINYQGQPRTFWTTARVRAADLRDGDVATIDRHWRWIYGVNEEGDEAVAALYEKMPETMVVVRYALDDKSSPDNFEDAILAMCSTDLVEIQVPVDHPPSNLKDRQESGAVV